MKGTKIILLSLFVLYAAKGSAQEQNTLKLTLGEALDLAKHQSELSKSIVADYQSYLWSYEASKASLLPQISIGGNLPNYNSTIIPVTQPDGSVKLYPRTQLNSNLNVNIQQNILPTGGTLFLSSGLAQYNTIGNQSNKYWQASPLTLGIIQPLTLFNTVKWNFEQTKLRKVQATKKQVEDFEDLSLQVTQAYFELYVASMQLENARKNVAINDTLYKISTGRFDLGKIAENELLQVELQMMNAKNSVMQNELRVTTDTKRLRNLLNIREEVNFDLVPVTDAPVFEVDDNKAIEEAKANRSDLVGFQLQENNAEMELKRAQANKFANGTVQASFGLNQSATTLGQSYLNPLNSQQVMVGVSLPVVGWGQYKSRVSSSKYNLESTREQLQYQMKNFEIQVETAVNQFKQLQTGLEIAAKSDTIAQKRYEVAKDRYLLGKISITDLGLAQDAKDQAFIQYIQTLEQYWIAYYSLRRNTLYDFQKNEKITD